jgi:hypothetical protein
MVRPQEIACTVYIEVQNHGTAQEIACTVYLDVQNHGTAPGKRLYSLHRRTKLCYS